MAVRRKYLVINGCPVPRDVAPYVYLVLRRAHQTANSIYRGTDPEAVAILHRHGKHTQAEIHAMMPTISNPAGRSEHELRSDGVARPGPVGRHLDPWQVGIDSGTDSSHDKDAIVRAAAHYGLVASHPYSRGVEGHHWHFARQPKPNKRLSKAKVWATRVLLEKNR
jgi:hypothetical protein